MEDAALDAMVRAFLFEMATSAGVDLSLGHQLSAEDLIWDPVTPAKPRSFRALVQGSGADVLLRMYASAIATYAPEFSIVAFAKILEFVSATVVERENLSELQRKLASPRALSPDATYLKELKRIVERQKRENKDAKAMARTVEACCVASDLRHYAPPCCSKLRQLAEEANDSEESAALADFSDRLSSTRNSVVHAKANYDPTGKECPDEQLADFALLTRRASEQAIRWFAGLHESLRVVTV